MLKTQTGLPQIREQAGNFYFQDGKNQGILYLVREKSDNLIVRLKETFLFIPANRPIFSSNSDS